jgi:hypothetical protein
LACAALFICAATQSAFVGASDVPDKIGEALMRISANGWKWLQTSKDYCCKSRKSNNRKNLAKANLQPSPLLHRLSVPLWRSGIDFGSVDMVPHVIVRKTHQWF